MIGTTVGNHRIIEKLGDGGMGTVYRAVDQMLDREVAIKVLRPELTRQTALNERFRSEAIAMARVSHPNIAMLHGLERHGDDLFMVMEYVRGETLEHVVQRAGKLSWRRAGEILTSVLDALDHAHDMGVVHRDIKPANIMITRNGAVKVMDFGIARMVGRTRQTQFGHAVGTPTYMAPEQLRGEDVDGRTDLYAVGAALFELITGRMAFEADSDYQLMMMQLNDPPPKPSAFEPEVPASIDSIVLRAMEKKAEDRFPSAAAFRNALQEAVRDAPKAASDPARAAAAAPATRFADPVAQSPSATAPLPPSGPIASTRRAEPEPATIRRVTTQPLPVTEEQPRPSLGSLPAITSWTNRLSPSTRERLRDWRTWAIAASLFVSAGMLALAFKPSGATANRSAADSVAVPTGEEARVASSVRAQAADQSPAANVSAAPQNDVSAPPAPRFDQPPQEQVTPEPRPRADRTRPPRNAGSGGGSTASPPPPASAKDIALPAVTDPPKETKAADPPPSPVAEESPAAARAAVAEGLAAFMNAVNSGSAAEVDRLLRGPERPRAAMLTLVREGRLTMRGQPDGMPSLAGSEVSVPFEAQLSWRTPFGSVRRNTMPMLAAFSRSGRTWRLESVRMVRPIDFR